MSIRAHAPLFQASHARNLYTDARVTKQVPCSRRLRRCAVARPATHLCGAGDQRRGEREGVQKLMGHKTAVLTLDRYGHLFPDDLDAVAHAFDSAADALRTITALRPGRSARKSL